jgi:hypothetical protein
LPACRLQPTPHQREQITSVAAVLTALTVIFVAAAPIPLAKVSTAGLSYVNLSDREGDA